VLGEMCASSGPPSYSIKHLDKQQKKRILIEVHTAVAASCAWLLVTGNMGVAAGPCCSHGAIHA
jgi:hypothetical protein